MEWSWWVISNNAYEPSEQLIVLAYGDDESDLDGWTLLLLITTVRSFEHMPLGLSDSNTIMGLSMNALGVNRRSFLACFLVIKIGFVFYGTKQSFSTARHHFQIIPAGKSLNVES